METTLYTLDEVAEMLKVTRTTIYEEVRDGYLEANRVGKRQIRITASAIEKYLKENKYRSRVYK